MDTTAAQRALIALGYDLGKGGPSGKGDDGRWGELSACACAIFQRGRGLAATGVLTAETIHALQAAIAERSEPRATLSVNLLTPAIVKAVAPAARADIVAELLRSEDRFAVAGVTTRRRMAHFLAQIATETGGLRAIEESLNYTPEGLLKTCSRARISAAQCQALGRITGRAANQPAIANQVYGGEWGRKNLGNTQPGDGWRYRGGGLIQTTGRANYRDAGFEGSPEALRTVPNALASALKFWSDKKLNATADTGTVAAVRLIVNGGSNGLHEAETYFALARKALGL